MLQTNTLEIHATHACNLSCKGCTHYCDNKLKGMITPLEAESWMKPWSTRIKPKRFVILGGEPTLNKDLTKICDLSRKYWTESEILLISNGFFLDRHPNLEQTLKANNIRLAISIHGNSPEYYEHLQKIKKYLLGWNVPIEWRECYDRWLIMYKGYGSKMEPFEDGNPQQSWKICLCKYCNQLFEGKIWKCPNITYLRMQLEKHGLENNEKWQKYLQYQPLSYDCTDEELMNFFILKEENICNMCPSREHEITNDKNPLSLPVIRSYLP